MKYEEALEWLKGERSMINHVQQEPLETWQARIAEADAAMTQQAYWIVRAHRENNQEIHYEVKTPAPRSVTRRELIPCVAKSTDLHNVGTSRLLQ